LLFTCRGENEISENIFATTEFTKEWVSISKYSYPQNEKVENTSSPLTGEGWGKGEESGNFAKLFIPLPFIPSRHAKA
jgi:hypothetical protein